MDGTTIGVLGIGATLTAVLLTYWFSQRSGEQRANHVRDEVVGRLNSLDARISEVKTDFNLRLAEMRAESTQQSNQLRSEFNNTITRVEARIEGVKEVFSLELKAMKAEILAALPGRARAGAGSADA